MPVPRRIKPNRTTAEVLVRAHRSHRARPRETAERRFEETLRARDETARHFQQRLKALHEISLLLSGVENTDELCRQAIIQGRARLGFDRLGLFLFEPDSKLMLGTFGTDMNGELRDERLLHVPLSDREDWVVAALRDHAHVAVRQDTPLYDNWEIVGRGWNTIGGLWHGDKLIGWLAADNYINQQPLQEYEPELLSLYGSMLGHLVVQKQTHQRALELDLEKQRIVILGEYMDNLAHDFKTPLTIINSSLYLLERITDPERRQAKLALIKSQTALLEKYIQDILTIARLERAPALRFQPTRLNDLLTGIEAHLRPAAENKSVMLAVDLDPALPLIEADSENLNRAFVNLVENAVNYTDVSGSVTVRSRLDGEHLLVEVIDTGMGIEPEALPHVFDRFFRADSARLSHTGGTGLGLAIVQRVIEMHHGTVEVTSQVGGGSTFRVRLPLHLPSA